MLIRHRSSKFGKLAPKGFTIVELLVVIVVIGILAVIAVSSYTGAQLRAKNQQNLSTAGAYYKALITYATDYNAYPPDLDWWPCMGAYKNDVNNDGLGDCIWQGTTAEHSYSPNFHNALRRYIDITAGPSDLTTTDWQGRTLSGIQYFEMLGGTLNGQPHEWFMNYFVKAPAKCTVGQVVYDVGWPAFSTSSSTQGYTYEEADGGRWCVTKLPNPAMN
ncbi:prepilin-type N-terminal cleavage/methylation domain-containing protein [Candidatus Saccharibacteria bacterium]|nr:prepilin-type N-terminal cleavage/methylation domain-containing protein [Candidatus Saccharibacteria bacterium]